MGWVWHNFIANIKRINETSSDKIFTMAKEETSELNGIDFKWLKSFRLEELIEDTKKEFEEKSAFDLWEIQSSTSDLCKRLKQLLLHAPDMQGPVRNTRCVRCGSLCPTFVPAFTSCFKSFGIMEYIVQNDFQNFLKFKSCWTHFLNLEGIENGNQHKDFEKRRQKAADIVIELEKRCNTIRESLESAFQYKDTLSDLLLSSEVPIMMRNNMSYMECLSILPKEVETLNEKCETFISFKCAGDFFKGSKTFSKTLCSIRVTVLQSTFLYVCLLLFKLEKKDLLLGELLDTFCNFLDSSARDGYILKKVKTQFQDCLSDKTIDRDIKDKLNEKFSFISKKQCLSIEEWHQCFNSLCHVIQCHYQTADTSAELPKFAQKFNEVLYKVSELYDKSYTWWTIRQPNTERSVTDVIVQVTQCLFDFSSCFKSDYMKRCNDFVIIAMKNAEKIPPEHIKIGLQKQGQECVRGLPLLSKHLYSLITSKNHPLNEDLHKDVEHFTMVVKKVFTCLWQFHQQLERQDAFFFKCEIDTLKTKMISFVTHTFGSDTVGTEGVKTEGKNDGDDGSTTRKTEKYSDAEFDFVDDKEELLIVRYEELKTLIENIKKKVIEAMSKRVSTDGQVIFHKNDNSQSQSASLIMGDQNFTSSQRECYVIVNLNAVLKISLWSKNDNVPVMEVIIVLDEYNSVEVSPFITKYIVNGLAVMQIRFAVSRKLIGKMIQYKYYVHSECETTEELEEMIVAPDHGESQRCYRILKLFSPKEVDEVNVYDNCIYPAEYSDSSGLTEWFLSKFYWKPKFKIPNRKDEVQNCVTAYMKDNFERLMNEELSSWEDVFNIYETSHKIYICLKNLQKIYYRNNKGITFSGFNSDCQSMFLLKFDELCQNIKQKDFPSDQRMFIVLTLCRCYVESLGASLTVQQSDLILSLCPNESCNIAKECERLSILNDPRSTAPYFRSLLDVMNMQFSTVGLSTINWIYAFQILNRFSFGDHIAHDIPKYNLVDSFVEAFDRLSEKFRSIKKRSLSDSLESKEVLETLKVDPTVGLLLCQACYDSECHLLVGLVPAPALLIHIDRKLQIAIAKKSSMNEMIEAFNCLLWKLLKENAFCLTSAEATKLLIKRLIGSWQFFGNIHLHSPIESFVRNAIQLASRMIPYVKCEWEEPCSALVKRWVEISCGTKFQISQGMALENKVWQELGKMSTNEKWQELLKKTVQDRIKHNKSYRFGDHLTVLEIWPDENSITMCVMKDIVKEEMKTANAMELKRVSKGDTKLSRMLLCNHLETAYLSKSLTLENLLSWELWPDILKVYRIEDNQGAFTDRSKHLCESAILIVEEEIEQPVRDGEISVLELEQFESQESSVTSIMEAIHGDKQFSDVFSLAKKKVRIFKVYSQLVCHLLEKSGVQTRREDKYKNAQINELCDSVEGTWVFPAIDEPAPSVRMLVQFAIMTSSLHQTDLFYTKWELFKNNMLSSKPYNYVVWDEWFSTLYCLVEKLEKYEITFSELFEIFGGHERGDIKITIEGLAEGLGKCSLKDTGNIEWISEKIDLSRNTLIDEIDSIFQYEHGNMKWINNLTIKIAEWLSVHKLSQYADEMLGILDNLGIASSVCEPLKLVSRKGLTLLQGKMLKEVSGDVNVLLCLRDFEGSDLKRLMAIRKMTELKDLREWIQSKSEDFSSMQTFIEVAMDTTANEGDEINDRLHALSDFCGTFSHIIFTLKQSEDSLQSLLKLIRCSWSRITSYESASTNIENCNSNFQWYKEIGELQGSVERGTKKQLEDINKYGVYHIKAHDSEADFELTLELEIDDLEQQNLSQKMWKFEELLELESKLVLITRPNSPWINDKSEFQSMLSGVTKMKEIMQKLKEHGYLGQLKNDYSLRCSDFKDEKGKSKLKKQCEHHEMKLVEWITYVWNCRLQYYELNFYTTKQLITLRREITRIRDSKDSKDDINPHTYHLLQSVIGKPIESSVLIRRSLPSDEDETEDLVEKSDQQKESENISPGPLLSEPQELSKLEQEIIKLEDSKRKIFEQLKENDPFRPECLYLEAVLQPDMNEFTSAMFWCDEQAFDEEYIESLQEKWHTGEDTLSVSSESPSISNLVNISQQEENPLSTREATSDKIDLAVIVDAFIPFKDTSLGTGVLERELSEETKMSILTIRELGQFLKNVVKKRADEILTVQRQCLKDDLQEGTPNLIVTSPFSIFACILEIYRQDVEQPLPGFEEVLLCSESTSLEEIVVFWMRALYDEDRGRIFCVVHAEKLPYLVAEKALDLLKYLSQGVKDYRLIIVCSSERDEKSPVITRLHANRRSLTVSPENSDLKDYLNYHVTLQNVDIMGGSKKAKDHAVEASCVDDTKSQIRVVISYESGVGKSLYIHRMRNRLVRALKEKGKISERKSALSVVTVPLHGPIVTTDEVLSILLEQTGHNSNSDVKEDYRSTIVHLDIPSKVLRSVDDILFSLLILKGLSNSKGQIWRCLPTQLYAVEVTLPSTKSYLQKFPEVQRIQELLKLLPSSFCVGPMELKNAEGSVVQIDPVEVRTPMYQRVYQYLRLLEEMNSTLLLENFTYMGVLGKNYTDESCIETILKHIGLKSPSWKELRHFVWFLNIQLNTCEESNLMRQYKGLKSFTVAFMKIMSRDFATSSMTEGEDGTNILIQHEIAKDWGESVHPYLFFNKDRCSVTHMGLALNESSSIVDSVHGNRIDIEVSPEVLKFLKYKAKVPLFPSDDDVSSVQKLVEFWGFHDIEQMIEIEKFKEYITLPLKELSYVLTTDNVLKLLGIQTRFRCRIPVVLMGETGCGKTHLIRFMCKFAAYGGILMNEIKESKRRKSSVVDELSIEKNMKDVQNMVILKVHGGTTEKDVIECLSEAREKALEYRKLGIETVVFFDEANTSEVISLIKEIMCDGRCKGIPIPPFLKFVAACNPYRRHSEAMIKNLKGAGLGWHDHTENRDATEKLGDIPLRDLVYRVHELPPSMRALVYDFGRLSDKTEQDYIRQIVKNKVQITTENITEAITNVLCACQSYMKHRRDECSFVSLRDIERIMIVFNYFLEQFLPDFEDEMSDVEKKTCSLVLAIGVCYHARLKERSDFERCICEEFSSPLKKIDENEFQEVIKRSQERLLDNMIIPDNIAKNTALRENIFMMFICIELRIPLFVVGKPGSSKSLAKTIIQNSMRGQHSIEEKMRKFQQIHLHSHQCSPLSTPSSIIEIFNLAQRTQDKKELTTKKFVSVVVLDEVGLAEASPYLPLKALHPLLEDGTQGSSSNDHRIEKEKRVAFIGISNWALDPAKMNRGIMVTRGSPTADDLILSAKGICSNVDGSRDKGNTVLKRLQQFFPDLATVYSDICEQQKREIYGLRDFYSLIKMLFWMSYQSNTKLTKAQIEHAIRRNFSGFSGSGISPVQKFMKRLKLNTMHSLGDSGLLSMFKDKALLSFKNNDKYLACSDRKLIWTDVLCKQAQFIVHMKSDGRSVSLQSLVSSNLWIDVAKENELALVEREDDAKSPALTIDDENGSVSICDYPEHLIPFVPNDPQTNPDNSPIGLIQTSLTTIEKGHGESRYLLFLTENYSAIQTLKHFVINTCLKRQRGVADSSESEETFQLEPYVLFGSSFPKDSEYTQVCRNISEIRLCMEAGRMVILLNLENLYESLYDVLNQYYIESGGHRYVDLGLRTHRMKCRVHKSFKLILIAESEKVYREFPIPLINRLEKHFVSSTTVLRDFEREICNSVEKWIDSFVNETETGFKKEDAFVGYNPDTAAAVVLQASSDLEYVTPAPKGSANQKSEVLERSKQLLLQLATPDSIIRAFSVPKLSINEITCVQKMYFETQKHSSLSALIKANPGYLVQVTTHSSSMSQKEIEDFGSAMNVSQSDIERCHLESFQTEEEFLEKIIKAIHTGKEGRKYLLILECDSGHLYGNLISCCRYRIVDKWSKENNCSTQIILLIHMPRKYPNSNFVSFQSHPWSCFHVDELSENIVDVKKLVVEKKTISQLFYSDDSEEHLLSSGVLASIPPRHLCVRIFHCIQEALGMHKTVLSKRHLSIFEKLIPRSPVFPIQDHDSFYAVVVHLIKSVLENQERHQSSFDWIISEASNIITLEESGTFVNAILRKCDRVIIPILSVILEFVNKNDNLLLAEDENPLISELWLSIFQSQDLCQRHLQQVALTTAQKSAISKVTQQCRFPFSWLIFNFIEEKSSTDSLSKELCNGDLENVLSRISSESEAEEFLSKYIDDFIYLALTNIKAHLHHKLLRDAFLTMTLGNFSDRSSLCLFKGILATHQIFHQKKNYFVWFSQLISQMPHILDNVCKTAEAQQKQTIKELLFNTVHEAITNKYTNLGNQLNEGSNAVRSWLHKQYETQHILNSIFKNECRNPVIRALNPKWQWICTTRMFMEEIVLKNEQVMNTFAVKLQTYSLSLKHNDLHTPDALNTVALVINLLEDVLQKGRISVTDEEKVAITENCWNFFTMVISKFCMDVENGPPDEGLLNRLIDMIFPSPSMKSKDMFQRLMQNHQEQFPNIKSLFLKLLLQHDFSIAEGYLKIIFSRVDEITLKDCCLVVIEYLKDNFELSDDKSWTSFVANYLRKGFDEFNGSVSSTPISLLMVSRLQLSMICLANWIVDQSHTGFEDADIQFFLSEAKTELRKEIQHKTSCGPVWFLTEVIVRKFGYTEYLKTTQTDFKWIVADEKLTKDSYHFFDVAALYNPVYEEIRSVLTDAIAGDMNELVLKSESLSSNDTVPLALALYQRVRLSHVSNLPLKQINSTVLNKLLKFVRCCKLLSDERIQEVVVSLIENRQCMNFSLMQAKMLETAEDNISDLVRTVVIHSVLAVLANRRDNLIKVLFLLMTSPESLKDSFLPGMPLTIPKAYDCGGEFPSCEKAHKHPSVLVDQLCLDCGNRIVYKPNKPSVLNKMPHIVVSPGYIQDKGNSTPFVGHTSSVSYSIIRIILHSCLLWASCNGKNVQGIFTSTQIDYASFFWQQINHDLSCLSKALGRSIPEISIIVHLVLKEITQKDHGVIENMKNLEKLTSEIERQEWEEQFESEYVSPILQDVDGCLRKRIQRLSLKDYNKLFSAAYVHSDEDSHYWQFYPQISVDHFKFNTISLKLRSDNPVLYMFLTEQENIEVTQCIPSIVQLQQLIQQTVCQKFGQEEQRVVEEMTFKSFVDSSQDKKMEPLLQPLLDAWRVTRHNLLAYDRLDISREHILDEITEHTKMKHLIPTTNGPGVITTALVDFLVNIHNGFIVTSRKFLEESLQRDWLWPIRTVSIQKVDEIHLVDCKDKFLPLIHSHYIRKIAGGSCEIMYDVKGLEKDLILNFVMGKPIIADVFDIPVPLWQDLTTVLSMKTIERNIPQEQLSQQAKVEILSELKNVSLITSVREVLETAMKFLHSKKYKYRKGLKLKDFIERDLGMFGRLKSKKVCEYCSLANVVALWKLLSVERMKFCVRNNEEPFLECKNVRKRLSQPVNPKDTDTLEKALSKMNRVEVLLDVVFQFILAQNSMKCLEKNLKLPLKNELDRFIEQTDTERIQQLSELFPECIEVCQAVETWKKIVLHQDDVKKKKQ